MIQTAVTTQPAKPTPFRPSNFYEVPLGASRQPPSLDALEADAAPCPTIPLTTAVTSKVKSQPQRRTLRTVMLDAAGKLQGAKLDLTTGEVVPHQYKDPYAATLKARRNPDAAHVEPFWVGTLTATNTVPPEMPQTEPAALSDTLTPQLAPSWMRLPNFALVAAEPIEDTQDKQDKSRKKLRNGAKYHLQNYVHLHDAVEGYPVLDHIMCGTTALDLGGNTRGLNRKHLFTLLQNLDVISPMTVRDFAGHSKSHSEKVAACLRIIVNAFMGALGEAATQPGS